MYTEREARETNRLRFASFLQKYGLTVIAKTLYCKQILDCTRFPPENSCKKPNLSSDHHRVYDSFYEKEAVAYLSLAEDPTGRELSFEERSIGQWLVSELC